MARHMRNGRDYSRPGPKVDYELRKDSNNAARSGDVYNKIEEIQSQIVPTASIESGETASKEYLVGDFLVKNGVLYKVINAIAEGDALTVGTNIVMTTVGGELSGISQYKFKEYTFEYTTTKAWKAYDIEELNAFLDGSSYFDASNKIRYPINYDTYTYCIINADKKIQFWSNYAGTIHAFVRYK